VRRLDDATLAAVAAVLCGDGTSLYRSARELQAFFRRAGVPAEGEPASRADWALARLEECNAGWSGRLLPHALERVLLRLAQPCEYRGDRAAWRATLAQLNAVLAGEELRAVFVDREAVLEEVPLPAESLVEGSAAPDFTLWIDDHVLARLVQERWTEAHLCLEAGAYVAATVLLGSILEGVLCRLVARRRAAVAQSPHSPRDAAGRIRPLRDWAVSDLVTVAGDRGWLNRETLRFAPQLTEFRALLHPVHQWQQGLSPDAGTCRVCRQALLAVLGELRQDAPVSTGPSSPRPHP
jgi:hypothetical protein